MNLPELVYELLKMDFLYFKPLAKTWSAAFLISKNNGETLCILLRKKGIDFRYYAYSEGLIRISPNFKVSFSGGEIYRHFYYKSDRKITLIAYEAAKMFLDGNVNFKKIISQENGLRLKSCESYKEFRKLKIKVLKDKFKFISF